MCVFSLEFVCRVGLLDFFGFSCQPSAFSHQENLSASAFIADQHPGYLAVRLCSSDLILLAAEG